MVLVMKETSRSTPFGGGGKQYEKEDEKGRENARNMKKSKRISRKGKKEKGE
jgi:hypothetical protein